MKVKNENTVKITKITMQNVYKLFIFLIYYLIIYKFCYHHHILLIHISI
jgi:hypothetical protein